MLDTSARLTFLMITPCTLVESLGTVYEFCDFSLEVITVGAWECNEGRARLTDAFIKDMKLRAVDTWRKPMFCIPLYNGVEVSKRPANDDIRCDVTFMVDHAYRCAELYTIARQKEQIRG